MNIRDTFAHVEDLGEIAISLLTNSDKGRIEAILAHRDGADLATVQKLGGFSSEFRAKEFLRTRGYVPTRGHNVVDEEAVRAYGDASTAELASKFGISLSCAVRVKAKLFGTVRTVITKDEREALKARIRSGELTKTSQLRVFVCESTARKLLKEVEAEA